MTSHQLHHLRDANGFIKSVTYSIGSSTSMTGSMITRIPNPTLLKAQDMTQWDSKLVSDKIRIVGVAYNLSYQPTQGNVSGQYPASFPVRFDLIRQYQSVSGGNNARYTTDNSYLKKHSFSAPTANSNVIDVNSMFNCPLAKEEKGFSRILNVQLKHCKMNVVPKYNSDQLNNTLLSAPIVQFSSHIQTACELEIPDDGNPATSIDIQTCIGEIPELYMVTMWNSRAPSSPFALTHACILVGQVTYFYQDIGTKLSHL